MPFGWCPCALFIELLSLHLRKHGIIGQDYPPHGMHITIIGVPGWVPAVYDMSGPNYGLRCTSVATQVIKCGYGKEGEQQYALVPGGLARWTETALWTWQAIDLALIQWC